MVVVMMMIRTIAIVVAVLVPVRVRKGMKGSGVIVLPVAVVVLVLMASAIATLGQPLVDGIVVSGQQMGEVLELRRESFMGRLAGHLLHSRGRLGHRKACHEEHNEE